MKKSGNRITSGLLTWIIRATLVFSLFAFSGFVSEFSTSNREPLSGKLSH